MFCCGPAGETPPAKAEDQEFRPSPRGEEPPPEAAPAAVAEPDPPPAEKEAKGAREPAPELPLPPDGAKHVLVVRVVQAIGLKNDEEENQPYVKVRILDPEGKETMVKETKPSEGGNSPQWNEYLKFEDIEDPALCTVCLELLDKNAPNEPADGIAKVKLGELYAAPGFQQFREDISSGWFSDVDLRFGLNNFGTWGNGARAENKLTLNVIGASALEEADTGIGGLFGDKNDPYVTIELFDEDDRPIGKPVQTKVLQEGGNDVEWNETFEFADLLCPSAYKLSLSVWDKDTCKKDDALGKTDFALGRCFKVPDPVTFVRKLEGHQGNLKFSVSTGGAWGTITKEKMAEMPPAEWEAPPPPPGHYMRCTVLSATGLAAGKKGNDGKNDPICRLTLRDDQGVTIQTFSTKGKVAKAKAKAKPKKAKAAKGQAKAPEGPKPDVEWNEKFLFKGVVNPCMCTLSVNVLDAAGDQSKRLGETTLDLGMLAAKPGEQDFEQEIAGFFYKSKVKLQIDNFGSWGNGKPEENKLYMMVKSAVGLPTHMGTLFRSKTDPYVQVELKGPDGSVLQTKSTTPKPDAGSDPEWNEELVFENIENPAACSLYIVCYDESAGKDQRLGSTKLECGVLSCSSEYTAFSGTTLGGHCKLDLAMHTGGTWGNREPGPEPEDAAGEKKACCSVM